LRSRTRVANVVATSRPASTDSASVTSVITTVRTSLALVVGSPAASRYSRTKLRTPSMMG